MRTRLVSIFWGIVLMLGGALLLAENLGLIDPFSPQTWIFIFTGLSLLFFLSYFLYGIQQWGWLFPACFTAALAITASLGVSGVESPWMAAPILLSFGLPFLAAFLLDRRRWWALIPAWVMLVISLITLLADRVQGEWIAGLVLLSMALPFLLVYLADRTRRWALIPAFTIGAIGIIPLLAISTRGEWIAAFVMFAFALPFYGIYLWSRQHWWALIPAGILSSLALLLIVIGLGVTGPEAMLNGLLFLGFAATFGVLWLLRRQHGTDWAKYPAVALAIVAGLSFILGTDLQTYWPVLVVAAGLWLLYASLRRK